MGIGVRDFCWLGLGVRGLENGYGALVGPWGKGPLVGALEIGKGHWLGRW